jgi:hypothetical protein
VRHILVIIALIVTAWAVLPGAASAHEGPHQAMAGDALDCPDCPAMQAGAEEAGRHDCHHGTSCGSALHALPAPLTLSVAAPTMSGVRRPAAGGLPRSALLLRDLPPPRS